MKTVKITSLGVFQKEVVLFDSIKELPAWRYHELNKLFMQDAQIGSDMGSVAKHYSILRELILKEKKKDALVELQNLHNNLFYTIEGLSIKSFCFMAMVHSIQGAPIFDFSQEGTQRSIKNLSKSGLKHSQVSSIVEELKKNFHQNLEPIFLVGMGNPGSLMSIIK